MDEIKFPFTLDYQHSIIKWMLKDEGFGINCVLYLKPEYFGTTELFWAFKFINRYYTDYRIVPNFTTLKNEVLKFDDKQRPAYDLFIKRLEELEDHDRSYIHDNLTKFVKRSVLIKRGKDMANAFNSGDEEGTYKVVDDLQKELNEVGFEDDQVIKPEDIWGAMERTHQLTKNKLKLGIEPLDQAMITGIPMNQLTIFLGTTNCGKSIILINSAYNFAMQGKKVLYIDLENDVDEMTLRMHSRITGIMYSKFGRPLSSFSEEEIAKIKKSEEFLRKYMILKPWHDKSVNVEDVWAYCSRVKHQFDYDVCLIDYGQLLRSRYNYEKQYQEQGEVHKLLNLMAVTLKIAVVTVVQSTRGAQVKTHLAKRNQEMLRMTDVSDSFEICRKAGIVITLTRTDHDVKNNTMKYLLDKNRRGDKMISAVCHTDFSTMKLFGPDVECQLYRPGVDDDALDT